MQSFEGRTWQKLCADALSVDNISVRIYCIKPHGIFLSPKNFEHISKAWIYQTWKHTRCTTSRGEPWGTREGDGGLVMGESYRRAWYREPEPRVTQILFLILPLLCIRCFIQLIIYSHLFNIGCPVVHSRNYFFCHSSNSLLHKVVLVTLVRKDVWQDLTGLCTKVQLRDLSWWLLSPYQLSHGRGRVQA